MPIEYILRENMHVYRRLFRTLHDVNIHVNQSYVIFFLIISSRVLRTDVVARAVRKWKSKKIAFEDFNISNHRFLCLSSIQLRKS